MIDESRTLDERLLDLGTAIAFPPTPPLAAMVAERLRQPGRRPTWARPIGRGMGLAVAATVLLAGMAAAFGLGIGGLRLTFGPASFSPGPSLIVGPGLGEPTSLDDARGSVQFTVLVPRLAELGDPALVYLADPPAGGAVTLLYGERDGFPADPLTGIGLIITQFRADIGPETFEKLVDSGVRVTATEVNGGAAWWVAGGDHFFFYRDANGQVVDTTLRLASDTLIWQDDGVTHRVEGAPTLGDAIRVAESLR
ncbi:MAG: hypothetical protein ABI864_06195 [Chloroflexota bacterium]